METLRFERPLPGEEWALAELRARAMRESLEAAGRFDEQRVRRRFLDAFQRDHTWVVRHGDVVVGFFVAEDRDDGVYLAHLYVDPDHQGLGIGAAVLDRVKAESGGRPIRLNALKGSRSNEFYRRHGFVPTGEDDVDRFYEFRPRDAGP